VWKGLGSRLVDCRWPWEGPAFATLYSACATLFEPAVAGRERQLEARAHLGHVQRPESTTERLRTLFRYGDATLHLDTSWRAQVQETIAHERNGGSPGAGTASAVQARIGELLLQVVAEIREALDIDTLCLGGGLFYNTYFTTLIRRSGIFRDVFVPINPGNSGLAVGGTLAVASRTGQRRRCVPAPFLGPKYDDHEIKATLDGCKLSYAYVSQGEALDATIDSLRRGQLVGWVQGRMEWGPRALGNRSILADPRSPYVLDNLNCFLRKRERSRSFGVSVSLADAGDYFCGPPASPFMEYEYTLRDDRLRHVMPAGATSIRVQTVTPEVGPFWLLHQRMKQCTGSGVIVNTSLNAFQEPIACTPRDAVRVFYGTGLDVLVIGRFILRK
jgi:carbamoyltransferase